MAAEVRDLDADKLFKIAKLNLRGRAREWLRRLNPAPANWIELRTSILQKYGNVDDDDIRAKLDAIRQEPKEWVLRYFERLDRLFRKGRTSDAEQKRRFLARLRPEIRKLCVVRNFADIEELVATASEVERVLGLGHSEERCWKKNKDEKTYPGTANFLEILLSDEEATLQQLNRLCGDENVFSYTRVPRRRMSVELTPAGAVPQAEVVEDGGTVNRENSIRSKILSHFIKGKVSLTPMETVMMIPGKLEQLENLVKVARRKRDAEAEGT
ncbi:unnamed protein product [Sphagnum jensenii]|uniref:Retrotransposon gag domain-containing protein n=1 Tax=Sphagnum jensenii TaxID=128206 RepID=A0ABP1C1D6_9BRYO